MARYIHPIKFGAKVSDNFADHVKRGAKMPGEDYPVKVGTPVRASRAGTVRTAADSHSDPGIWVQISHSSKTHYTSYMHLSKITVRVGQKVVAGQVIGYTGNTGNSTGAHLHFSLKVLGKYVDPAKTIVAD